MSKKSIVVIAVLIGVVAGAAAMHFLADTFGVREKPAVVSGQSAKEGRKILYWRAPMDPTFISDKPGKSPMGMDLIPVYEGEEAVSEPGIVKIDPVTVQNIGVRTARVERRELKKVIRTIGRVGYDEKSVHHVHTKVDGWIEKLYVDFTGEKVKKDDILLELYSPKLVSAQEEYLLAIKHRKTMAGVSRESIAGLAKRRLELWDVPPHQIKEIEETGTVMRTLHVHSPATGIVIDKPVTEGMYVRPGMSLYTIADISTVWVYADVYEYELPWIRVGQEAGITLASYPGKTFKGRVSFIYPYMEPKTRTNKVRLEFRNPGLRLKPDMYANVTLESVVAAEGVAVPSESVILSGERSLVILSRSGGKFTPRSVTLGAEAENYYIVTEGLSEGDTVVTSAHFLIDSESRLREAVTKMLELKKGGDKGKPGMEHSGLEGMGGGSAEKDSEVGMQHDMKGMDHSGMDGMDHGAMEKSPGGTMPHTMVMPAPVPGGKERMEMDMMQYGKEHKKPHMHNDMGTGSPGGGKEEDSAVEGMEHGGSHGEMKMEHGGMGGGSAEKSPDGGMRHDMKGMDH